MHYKCTHNIFDLSESSSFFFSRNLFFYLSVLFVCLVESNITPPLISLSLSQIGNLITAKEDFPAIKTELIFRTVLAEKIWLIVEQLNKLGQAQSSLVEISLIFIRWGSLKKLFSLIEVGSTFYQ